MLFTKRQYTAAAVVGVGVFLGGCSLLEGLDLPSIPFLGNNGAQQVSKIELSEAARQDHLGVYQNDPNNKAFAVSPSGEHGVAFNYPSVSEAQNVAMQECRRALQPGDLDCTLYDINGTIVLQTPVTLSPYQPE